MFGYVRAHVPELKVKESEIYKAVYCTLCRSLGKSYGFVARLTLSYDFTFLALLRLSLREECTGFEQKRCAFNPLKKCNYCKNTGRDLDIVTASAMIMLYYNLRDNISDSVGAKRLGYRLLLPLFSRPHKKAAAKYPELESAAKEFTESQLKLENDGCKSIDRAAEPTAKMLETVFSLISEDETERRILRRLGYCIGRWIYLCDAADDMEKDKKSGSYNVLLAQDLPPDEINGKITATLNMCIGEAASAAELLEFKRYGDIIRNIIYLGLTQTQRGVLDKKETNR